VAGLARSGDGIKDDFYGGRSHLSEVHIASRLSFNSIRLGLGKIFCFLQLPDQLFDFRNRCSNLPTLTRAFLYLLPGRSRALERGAAPIGARHLAGGDPCD
jgi:hypothetical protein